MLSSQASTVTSLVKLGGGGISNDLRRGVSALQSVFVQSGEGGAGLRWGADRMIRIGRWSKPVEGRETSHEETKGASGVLEKDRSRTEGRVDRSKGNLVWIPGVLTSVKPKSKALSK